MVHGELHRPELLVDIAGFQPPHVEVLESKRLGGNRTAGIVDPQFRDSIRHPWRVELDVPLDEVPFPRLERDVVALVLKSVRLGILAVRLGPIEVLIVRDERHSGSTIELDGQMVPACPDISDDRFGLIAKEYGLVFERAPHERV